MIPEGNTPKGNIPEILRNEEGLYEGTLVYYARTLFHTAQNLRHPYHNFRHMFHILWLCHEACRYYTAKLKLTPRQKRNLLIAALFHDFDHSGVMGHDDLNIERAIRGLRKHLLKRDKPYEEEISDLIRGTQYPYVVDGGTLELCGQILRDADVSQAFSVAWIQQVIIGLATEWGMKPIEVLRMQKPFLEKLSFLTDWAQELFPPSVVDAKKQESEELLALLE